MSAPREYRIVVHPAELSFNVREGESIMSAAVRHGYQWPNTCGGHGECSLCVFTVDRGEEALSAVSHAEEELLIRVRRTTLHRDRTFRLACQARVSGEGVVVFKKGVRAQQ